MSVIKNLINRPVALAFRQWSEVVWGAAAIAERSMDDREFMVRSPEHARAHAHVLTHIHHIQMNNNILLYHTGSPAGSPRGVAAAAGGW
jgi:hypothetical protein